METELTNAAVKAKQAENVPRELVSAKLTIGEVQYSVLLAHCEQLSLSSTDAIESLKTSELSALYPKTAGCLRIAEIFYIILAISPTREEINSDALCLLTDREIQVSNLVANGCSNKEIAGKLGISEWTISTHLRRIYAKLGVNTRAAMVHRCFGRLTNSL